MALTFSMLNIFEMEFIMKFVFAGYRSHRVNKKSNNHHKSSNKNSKRETGDSRSFGTTGVNFVELCNCDVLPWEACEHTKSWQNKPTIPPLKNCEPLEEFYY